MSTKLILIVEDNRAIRDALEGLLGLEEYSTCSAYDGGSALRMLLEVTPDLLLLDYLLPDVNGSIVVRHLEQHGLRTFPIILLTAYAKTPLGEYEKILKKPYSSKVLLETIEQLLAVKIEQGTLL